MAQDSSTSRGAAAPDPADAIRRALDEAGVTDGHELMIALALRYAHRRQLPTEGQPLRLFLTGPLRTAVTDCTNADVAERVLERVETWIAPRLQATAAESAQSTRRPRFARESQQPTLDHDETAQRLNRQTTPAPPGERDDEAPYDPTGER